MNISEHYLIYEVLIHKLEQCIEAIDNLIMGHNSDTTHTIYISARVSQKSHERQTQFTPFCFMTYTTTMACS